MGFSIERETVRILKDGFAGPPPSLERGETAAFAAWVREPYGAVFFMRRWKNGQWDTDLAITTQSSNGEWIEPAGYSGSGWRDPYDRPSAGWQGQPIVWEGETSSTVGEEGQDVVVSVFEGMASPQVAKLEVIDAQGQLVDAIDIRQDTGVFIVGVIGEESHTVIARGHDGSIIRDGKGREIRDVFDATGDDFPFEALKRLHEESDGLGLLAFREHSGGDLHVVTDKGDRKIEDPELVEHLRSRHEREWPRRVSDPDQLEPNK